jgi:hypothetical protein
VVTSRHANRNAGHAWSFPFQVSFLDTMKKFDWTVRLGRISLSGWAKAGACSSMAILDAGVLRDRRV